MRAGGSLTPSSTLGQHTYKYSQVFISKIRDRTMAFRLLRIQPFKGFYLTYQILITLFIRLPLWIVFAFPRQGSTPLVVFFVANGRMCNN
jgi:hypothetical protein